jgi:proteasome alpha subunit
VYTPYDWQEGIGNRAQYIEGKLTQGAPAMAISLDAGILVFTYRRQSRKIFEIYDRLIYTAIGMQSDVESLRNAAVEFAHQEGYNRSEQDVTIQRVAAALSTPLKKAFGDFSTAPLVVRSLFGEVSETPDQDLYYLLDYDGNFTMARHFAAVAGSVAYTDRINVMLAEVKRSMKPEKAVDALADIWKNSLDPEDEHPNETQAGDLLPEAILLERRNDRENRFRVLTGEYF